MIDLVKFTPHDLEIDRVTIVSAAAAAGVAAIALYLGIDSILKLLTGGDGGESGDPPAAFDVTAILAAIKINLNEIRNYLKIICLHHQHYLKIYQIILLIQF